jgi:hypothetical protein
MRLAGILHDLSLGILAGGIAGIGLAVNVLFSRAPSREIAGQIGNVIFSRLGPATLALALIVLATRLYLNRQEPASGIRTAALAASVIMAVLAALVALWLTPAMGAIWRSAAHAPDGSGLTGGDRSRFIALHVGANVAYLVTFLLGLAQIAMRAWNRR